MANLHTKYHVYLYDGRKFFISDELVEANSPMTARSYIIRALANAGGNHGDYKLYPIYLGKHSTTLPNEGYAIY